MLALSTFALLEHPDQLALLRERPELYEAGAVDELLRYLTISQMGSSRCALEDVEIGGTTIKAGQTVVLSLPAANRDPEVFSDPDRLDVTRVPRRHLALGFGAHQCLGQHLARASMRIGLRSLFERFPSLRLAAPGRGGAVAGPCGALRRGPAARGLGLTVMARKGSARRGAKQDLPAFRTTVDSRVERVHTVRAGTADGARIRLTGYDLLTGPWYTPLTFFYRDTLDGAALRDSLARTLRRHPLLAGRLERDADGGLSVLCNDAGVRFTEASCPDPMREYGHGLRAEPVIGELLREVSAFRVVGRDTPLLKIRLTQMRGGGSILGVLINHSLADGGSTVAFLESWSREHLGLPWEEPSHDRGVLDALG
ncbi:cytochrome P450 [Streptomyces lasalocidi]